MTLSSPGISSTPFGPHGTNGVGTAYNERIVADDTTKFMQCMEVWGGNQLVDSGVIMPGLDAWVYSRPVNDDDGGGDVHYVSSCAAGMFVRLLVADVAGHGKPVA